MDEAPRPYGEFIAELRDRLGLTQATLAVELRVSVPTISRWETNRSSPDQRALHLVEQFLESQEDELADLVEELSAAADAWVASRGPKRRRRTRRAASPPAKPGPPETKSMETMLWRAACAIRGEKDAPKFKDYILPLVFAKRLSDVYDDEIARLAEQFGSDEEAMAMVDADPTLVRFVISPEARWEVISGRLQHDWPKGTRPKTLGEQLTQAMRAIARRNPSLAGVIDTRDFNEIRNGEREISDEALSRLIEALSDPRFRMGLHDVEPDFLGRAYEYLLRKFAEGQGQSAGEFFTPTEVGRLIAKLVAPRQGETAYDPCCGSGGLLIKCELELAHREPELERPLKLFGQELTGDSYAIARMNTVVHDMEAEIVRGNTMTNPKFLDGGSLRQFDVVVTNPMWNQDNFDAKIYEEDPFERFTDRGGYAPASTADWAWLQHVLASLTPSGRAAIVIDTGAMSRGSGSRQESREKAIRRWFVEQDVVEGVVLLPDNLFYNTTAAGVIVVLNRAKPPARRGRILFVNASGEFEKGRPKNFLPEAAIERIAAAVATPKTIERFARIVSTEDVADRDFNLSPSLYVETAGPVEHRDIQEILDELATLDAESRQLDGDLETIFSRLGYRWPGKGADV